MWYSTKQVSKHSQIIFHKETPILVCHSHVSGIILTSLSSLLYISGWVCSIRQSTKDVCKIIQIYSDIHRCHCSVSQQANFHLHNKLFQEPLTITTTKYWMTELITWNQNNAILVFPTDLAMVKMTTQCNIPYQFWSVHQVCQKSGEKITKIFSKISNYLDIINDIVFFYIKFSCTKYSEYKSHPILNAMTYSIL